MTAKHRLAISGLIFAVALVVMALGVEPFNAAWAGLSLVLILELLTFVNSPGINYWVGVDRADMALFASLLICGMCLGWLVTWFLFWVVDLAIRLPGSAL